MSCSRRARLSSRVAAWASSLFSSRAHAQSDRVLVNYTVARRIRFDLPQNWRVNTWEERLADAAVRDNVPELQTETLFSASRADERGRFLATIRISTSPGVTETQEYARSNPAEAARRLDVSYQCGAELVREISDIVTTNWIGTSWRQIPSGQLIFVTEREAKNNKLRVVEWIVTFYGGPGNSFAMFLSYNKDRETLFRAKVSIPVNSLCVHG